MAFNRQDHPINLKEWPMVGCRGDVLTESASMTMICALVEVEIDIEPDKQTQGLVASESFGSCCRSHILREERWQT